MPDETLPPAASFLADEYRLLRGEVEARSQEQRSMERNVVLITAGVYSFLLANPLKDQNPTAMKLAWVGWLIPPIVAFLALGRWLESLAMIKTLARYMMAYELEVVKPKGGWEARLHKSRADQGKGFVSKTNICFWTFMAGAPTTLAITQTLPKPDQRPRRGFLAWKMPRPGSSVWQAERSLPAWRCSSSGKAACQIPLTRTARKQFFFEKKNQKTFIN